MWGLCVICCICFCVLEIRADRGKEILPPRESSSGHKVLLKKSAWNGTEKGFSAKEQNFSNAPSILREESAKNSSTQEEWPNTESSSTPKELLFLDAPGSSTNSYLTNVSKLNIALSTAPTNVLSTIKTVALDHLKTEEQTADPLRGKTKTLAMAIKISTQPPNAIINVTEIPTFQPMKTSTDPPVKTVTPDAIQKVSKIFDNYRKRASQLVSSAMKQVLPSLIRYSSQVKLSSGCSTSIFQIILGLRKLEDWALKLLDASGKVPSGVLHGTISELGDYEECHDIVATNTRGRELFQGQYCSAYVQPLQPDHFEYHVYTTNKSKEAGIHTIPYEDIPIMPPGAALLDFYAIELLKQVLGNHCP
ncbi:uncharacterized protein LOC111086357 [Limulus polyphemus]|uniref:Uncharacterized protein LOC111086357 n=1 Tax=Limulus polyphemus TaxID=6850 RepID=A0ABM1SLV8_LIMPO|nr:uncharacterized protein LOC111086357 [Limulus polyphemus]